MIILRVREDWNGGATEVETERGVYTIREAVAGAFVGDFEITGANGFYSDGHLSIEKAIAKLEDME